MAKHQKRNRLMTENIQDVGLKMGFSPTNPDCTTLNRIQRLRDKCSPKPDINNALKSPFRKASLDGFSQGSSKVSTSKKAQVVLLKKSPELQCQPQSYNRYRFQTY